MTETPHADLSFAGQELTVLPPAQLKGPFFKDEDGNLLIFIHPPKTAGTNISFLMTALAANDSRVKVKRFAVPRVEGQSPNLITHGWRGGLESADAQLQAGQVSVSEFNFVSGHMPYGLHERGFKGRYLTLVRDPIGREISAANFDYQRGYIQPEEAEDYLLNRTLDNPQTRMLAGERFMSGKSDLDTLEAARRNLQTFLLAAPYCDSFAVLQVLAALYGARTPIAISKAQVTGLKIIDDSSTKLRRALNEKHGLDRRLYDGVVQSWDAWQDRHVKGEDRIIPGSRQRILTILPDFASTKKTQLLGLPEIDAHNARVKSTIAPISQNHSEIRPAVF